LRAGITQLVNKVASGDLKALKMWIFLSSKFPELLQEGNHDGFRIVFVDGNGNEVPWEGNKKTDEEQKD
jgi:hypothetical protein